MILLPLVVIVDDACSISLILTDWSDSVLYRTPPILLIDIFSLNRYGFLSVQPSYTKRVKMSRRNVLIDEKNYGYIPVSYTHLTLPTKRIV